MNRCYKIGYNYLLSYYGGGYGYRRLLYYLILLL